MATEDNLLPSSLITDVVADLRATWKGIGLPETEQDAKLTDVAAQIAAQLRSAVQAEEDKKRRLEEELESMGGELTQLSYTLDESCPDATPEAPALLVQRHAAASAALDSLKTVKATRAAQRREAEANVACLYAELHDPVDGPPVSAADVVPGPGPAEAGGLSEAFLGKLRAKVDELRSERAARIDQAAFLSSDVGRIQKELGDEEDAELAAPRRTTLEQLAGGGSGGGGASHQVSPSALEALEAKLRGLQAEQQRRRRVLEECLEYIVELRAKLHVGEADCPVSTTYCSTATLPSHPHPPPSHLHPLTHPVHVCLAAAAQAGARPHQGGDGGVPGRDRPSRGAQGGGAVRHAALGTPPPTPDQQPSSPLHLPLTSRCLASRSAPLTHAPCPTPPPHAPLFFRRPRILQDARDALRPLWAELHLGADETRSCAAAWPQDGEVLVAGGNGTGTDGADTKEEAKATNAPPTARMEELLAECEKEAAGLRARLEECGPILKRVRCGYALGR